MRAVRKIRIHCPIGRETFVALTAGDLNAIERDPTAARVLAVIRANNSLGDFGLYQGVFEIALGVEGFTPTARSRPTTGCAGTNSLSPTAIITTYIDAAADAVTIQAAISALMSAHPWEIPVIELSGSEVELAEYGDLRPSPQISK